MESHFIVVGVIPSGVILCPNLVIDLFANSHFCQFLANSSTFSRYRALSSSFSCSDSESFVQIRISSKIVKFGVCWL